MCEIAKNERRAYRDQDPPRILETAASLEPELTSRDADRIPSEKQQRREESAFGTIEASRNSERDPMSSPRRNNPSAGEVVGITGVEDRTPMEAKVSFPSSPTSIHGEQSKYRIITNGIKRESENYETLTNGREMAPVMGVPPPPPPAPDMGPDGLILPRKPYNPCLISNNHKDLRRELLFNRKVGKNVLNQKSELQRALEKQRETAMRKEAERNREETYKDDPRTALQRALEQRAKQIQLTEQPQNVEPPNPLVTARAKLRPCTDAQ